MIPFNSFTIAELRVLHSILIQHLPRQEAVVAAARRDGLEVIKLERRLNDEADLIFKLNRILYGDQSL